MALKVACRSFSIPRDSTCYNVAIVTRWRRGQATFSCPVVHCRLWSAVKHSASAALTVASFQAFMSARLLPCWDQLWLFVLLDPLLNCPSIILTLPSHATPPTLLHPNGCCYTVPATLRLPSSHLPLDPALPQPCTALRHSVPILCPLPACSPGGLWGTHTHKKNDHCGTWPILWSLQNQAKVTHITLAPSPTSNGERRRVAGVKGKRDKLPLSWTSQLNEELKRKQVDINTRTPPLPLRIVIKKTALEYNHHISCLLGSFDQIFRHVTMFECELIGNLFSALSLINTH